MEMATLIARQSEIVDKLKQINTNFDKDSSIRKTADYLKKRVEALDNLWGEFDLNNAELIKQEDKSHQYFVENVYQQTYNYYQSVRQKISSSIKEEKATQPCGEVDELLSQQRTNFRALDRLIQSIDMDQISEKWELEDELRNIQSRWRNIDDLHLRIDNIIQGEDVAYEKEFILYERSYKKIKRALNQKLCSTAHIQHATPQLEIPVFTGKYTQWPTFFDLFTEAIHNNNILSKAQKMQHLKGKLKGEAERLIQHLNISAENYDTAWEILTHRYNNPQVLFTKQIEIFLNQPNIHKQSSSELKRLYDTTTECIHAIHNLGVDTNTWDPLLVHLLLKKLDADTYSDYKEARKSPRDLPSLQEFMNFLEGKFIALEPIHKREREANTSSFKSNPHHSQKHPYNMHNSYGRFPVRNYQAVSTVPTYTSKCLLCNLDHELYRCKKFINMPAEIKLSTVAKLKICQNCLYKHVDKCISTKRCKICHCEHNTLLHDACTQSLPPATHSSPTATAIPSSSAKPPSKQHCANYVASDDEEVLLTTLLLKVKAHDGTYVTLRALLDQGSQIALMSENAAQILGLQRHSYHASISGIGTGTKQSKGVVSLQCESIYNDYQFTTQALVISRVINNLPNMSFSKQSWPHLQHINLADPDYNVSKPIDLLLDASIYSDIIMSGLIKGPNHAPIAQQTKLGWILSGNIKTFNCHVVINNLADIAKYWEVEDISNVSPNLTKEEQYCEELYQSTTRRLDNGRYEVALPMKPGYEQNLGNSKFKAIAQFKQLEHKMAKNETFSKNYKEFIHEYQELNHMRQVSSNTESTCFLPHHGVLKLDSSTTKLRVVFNASSKTTSGHSVNDLMECGPNLQHDLQALILKWRQYKYVITADIEKMFRQILIRESDQHLQAIIWRDSPCDPLQEYYLTTVTYGTKAAPFLAIRTLRQLAKDDGEKYPLAAVALENSFFMDDVLSGQNTIEETRELRNQLINILKGAGMNLRKWSANNSYIINDLSSSQLDTPFEFKCSESRKTLGLRWNPTSDTFTFQNKINNESKQITKRQLLSDISKIFDPLGWLSPLTIRAKLLFQKAWSSGASWDDKISPEIIKEWLQLRDDLTNIDKFSIPRYLGDTQQSYQLHGFCDASEKAYACIVYAISKDSKGEYTSNIIAAKTKLAPLNKVISLPRLELCGAVLLSQLMKKIKESISNEKIKFHAWTDSMVVLGWLHGDISRWKQFVANRVQQITNIIPASNWHHVKSEDNPADCATRGATVTTLLQHHLWWAGPEWLLQFNSDDISMKTYQSPLIEAKRSSVNATLQLSTSLIISDLLQQNSSITRAAKTIAWVSRFVARLQHKQTGGSGHTLSPSEINNALNLIIQYSQAHEFEEDYIHLKNKGRVHTKSKIASLNPYIDDHGVLRVGGRLNYSNISNSAKHPILLFNHSRLTELIIHQAHLTTLHGGPRLTLSFIREKYWIVSGMRTVKRELRRCVRCRRFSAENRQPIMADLPQPRVTPSRPFTHTGVDFTGHVDLKANKGRGIKTTKGYVAVFVCLSTKAVHLELVSDLSTPAFLAAFHRFCARRGTPRHMYSDNGTNFVGANRLLKREYLEIIRTINEDFFSNISSMDIEWSFNAAAWPSAGGLWEAAVKSFKHHLKRVLGEQKLTYEEFTTLLYQIEACLNSRPLMSLTENPEDDYLTPGHFLVGGSLLSRPQTDPEYISLPTRWQLVQNLNKQFWKRWSTDYLQQLQTRSKWRTPSKNLEVDDVVLIKDDNLPAGKWALGRVQELHPGRDGFVRVVSLKTQNKNIKRPVSKLVLLPVRQEATKQDNQQRYHHSSDNKQNDPRQRRNIKGNIYKNMAMTTLLLFMTFITPTVQHNPAAYNITSLNSTQGLYFDKISDLQYIRDDWKLIVYYNLSSYFQGLSDLDHYVDHLKHLCTGPQYQNIVLQLEHELSEIHHYNRLLTHQDSKRNKRGLINGIGYVANSLFGVLDDRFAQQYTNDIEQIVHNEKHLQNLFKNQTIVLEAEYGIIRRNEQVMNKHFTFINQHLHNLSMEVNQVRLNNQNAAYMTSSALTANIIISHIRRMQETLLNTITDISHGHIDTHLLSPEQLEIQLNIISGQLQADLSLPVEKFNIQDIYKLLRVSAKVNGIYLIIEIKIPLVSNEVFELDKIISIPQLKNIDSNYYIIPSDPYVAFNLRKDMILFLSEFDLETCIHFSSFKLLCSLNKPIYDLQMEQSICNLKYGGADIHTPACRYEQTPCIDRWIKLQRPNAWLYTCCQECNVRIFGPAGISMTSLRGSGIINLGQGYTLKSNTLTLYAHNNYLNKMNIQTNIEVPEVSILNTIINTTIPDNIITPENHDDKWTVLKARIDNLQEQSTSDLSIHDVHHYTVTYVVVAVLLLVGGIFAFSRSRRRCRRVKAPSSPVQRSADNASSEVNVQCVSSELSEMRKAVSSVSVDQGTSPLVSRSVVFQVPSE